MTYGLIKKFWGENNAVSDCKLYRAYAETVEGKERIRERISQELNVSNGITKTLIAACANGISENGLRKTYEKLTGKEYGASGVSETLTRFIYESNKVLDCFHETFQLALPEVYDRLADEAMMDCNQFTGTHFQYKYAVRLNFFLWTYLEAKARSVISKTIKKLAEQDGEKIVTYPLHDAVLIQCRSVKENKRLSEGKYENMPESEIEIVREDYRRWKIEKALEESMGMKLHVSYEHYSTFSILREECLEYGWYENRQAHEKAKNYRIKVRRDVYFGIYKSDKAA